MRILSVLVLLAGLSLHEPVRAADYYDIELIVFARTAPDDGEEYWPRDPGRPEAEDESLPADAAPGVEPLPKETWRMQNLAAALKRSPRYRLLLHWSWRQLLSNGSRTPWLRIRIPDTASLPSETPFSETARDSLWSLIGAEAAPPPLLEGVIRMSRARYLHFEADLRYAETEAVAPEPDASRQETERPAAEPAEAAGDTTLTQAYTGYRERIVRLHQRRRMRSREIHYLDHPRFGILVLATPYEPPPEEVRSEE